MTNVHQTNTNVNIVRRRLLQTAGLATIASFLPPWLMEHASAATPIGEADGVLVVLTMSGGNDGLNTFVPIGNKAYHSARPRLAISDSDVLRLNDGRGLHPNLPFVRSLWNQGHLAIVDGVGQQEPNLSHFISTSKTMSASVLPRHENTGWLGRYLDTLGSDPLNGLSFGTSLPQLVRGETERATILTRTQGNSFRRDDDAHPTYARQNAALVDLGRAGSSLGSLADRNAANMAEAVGLPTSLSPGAYSLAEPEIVTHMRMAAQIINANIGVRVLTLNFGDFDSHSDQAEMHDARMVELNAALRTFYGTLSDTFESRTLLLGTSEFGRRVAENGSGGTDHGTSNSLFLCGSRVNQGFHGRMPSLSDLDDQGNMAVTVDFRQVYASITKTWLGVDPAAIHGGEFDTLDLVQSPGTTPATAPEKSQPDSDPDSGPMPTPVSVPASEQRAGVARLYLAFFLRLPGEKGYEYWSDRRRAGQSLKEIAEEFTKSDEFTARYGTLTNAEFVRLVYRNVFGREAGADGSTYWSGQLNNGAKRGEMMVSFSESEEFRRLTNQQVARLDEVGPIARLYRAYFLRPPTPKGLAYWINSGLPPAVVSERFAESQEFASRYGTVSDREFVELIYKNVLGRSPTLAGTAYWLGALQRGKNRGDVVLEFANTSEFVAKVESEVAS